MILSPTQSRRPPRLSKMMPALIIFVIGIIPEPCAIAFGGVETGNMNPQLAPSVAPMAGGKCSEREQ